MVPRIAARGKSFKGVHLYVFTDKNQAQVAERLLWWHVENLPTDDPERAWRLMSHTALNAEALRREAGSKGTGRKVEKPVFWFSLSWGADQQPEREHMIATGRAALAALELSEHQAVFVAHGDGVPHIHVITNSIHPETGLSHTPSYSKLSLSKWAQAYELEHGQIICAARVENNERRAKGESVKYEDRKLITRLYREAENAQAFKASLEQYGYQLAQGNKLLLIDREGKARSLAKQIDDAQERELRAYLQDVEMRRIKEDANRQARAKEEEQSADRQRKEAEESERKGKRQRAPRQAAPVRTEAPVANPAATAPNSHAVRRSPQPEGYNGLPLPTTVVRLENQQRDELESFLETNRVIRERWQWQLGNRREQEQAERLRASIADFEKQREALPETPSRWSGARGQVKEIEERLTEMRAALSALVEREQHRRVRDEQEAREHLKGLAALQKRHEQERQALHENPKMMLGKEGRAFNQQAATEQKTTAPEVTPLVELPATWQAKIKEQAQAQRATEPPPTANAPINDNRRPEQQAFNRAAQRPEPPPVYANDNRSKEAQEFNRTAQGQQKEPVPPVSQVAPADPLREQQEFMRTLQGYGLSEAAARRLSMEKTEACRAKIPAIPTLLETAFTKNQAGYIRAFIERDDWQAPVVSPEQAARSHVEIKPEQSKEPDESRAAREALLDQWQGRPQAQSRQPRQSSQPVTSERTQRMQSFERAAAPELSEEDKARYALLDQWQENAAHIGQRVPEGQHKHTNGEQSSQTYSAEDEARNAILDGWNAGPGHGPVLGWEPRE